MSICTKVRSSGEICGNPCADGQKKDRCSKHKGLDPIQDSLKTIKKEKAPKPGSKKWQEQQGLSIVSTINEVFEKNPYSMCAVDLTDFDTKEFDVLSNYNGKMIIKGTLIYTGNTMKIKCGSGFRMDLEYVYTASNFTVEILTIKTHNGKGNWGNVKVPVVKNQEDLKKSKPSVTFMEVNTCIIETNKILSEIPEDATYESLFSMKSSIYTFPDFDETVAEDWRKSGKLSYTEREVLLYNAGNGQKIRVFGKKDDSTMKIINLSNVNDEALIKLHKMKLKWRNPIEDDFYGFEDTKYAEYLVNVADSRVARDAGDIARESAGFL
jgi:hypothetical protein